MGNKKLAHNLGTWPKGDKKAFQFNDAGVASLLCNVHPEMNGYVVVSPTPYFALRTEKREKTTNEKRAGREVHPENLERRRKSDHAGRGSDRQGATADLTVKK